jgi:hypothetical protein
MGMNEGRLHADWQAGPWQQHKKAWAGCATFAQRSSLPVCCSGHAADAQSWPLCALAASSHAACSSTHTDHVAAHGLMIHDATKPSLTTTAGADGGGSTAFGLRPVSFTAPANVALAARCCARPQLHCCAECHGIAPRIRKLAGLR